MSTMAATWISRAPMAEWLTRSLDSIKWKRGTGTVSTAGKIMCGAGTAFDGELKRGFRVCVPSAPGEVLVVEDVIGPTLLMLEHAPATDFDCDAFDFRDSFMRR